MSTINYANDKFDLFSSQIASTSSSPLTSYDEQEQWMFHACMPANISHNSSIVSAPLTSAAGFTGYFDKDNEMKFDKFSGIPDLTLINEKLNGIQEIKQEFDGIPEDFHMASDFHADAQHQQRNREFARSCNLQNSTTCAPEFERNSSAEDLPRTRSSRSSGKLQRRSPSDVSSSNNSVDMSTTSPSDSTSGGRKKRDRKKLTSDQKLAHNKIEKRYRVNINTKILGLSDIVPTLKGKGDKLNKSSILEMTTEYIMLIQAQNLELKEELKRMGKTNRE